MNNKKQIINQQIWTNVYDLVTNCRKLKYLQIISVLIVNLQLFSNCFTVTLFYLYNIGVNIIYK